jgi:1-acyl-sn-glycerol-3-phosphate acyltransferase
MIRFILVWPVAAVYFILSLPLLPIVLLLRKKYPVTVLWLQRMVQLTLRAICRVAGCKVKTIGYENIPDDTPVLYAANHLSVFDVLLCYGQMKQRGVFVAKKNLEWIPFLSWSMKVLRCPFLDRENMRQGVATIKECAEMMKNENISIFIFQEGTRNKTGDPLQMNPFHDGSLQPAKLTKCPIIPVCILNTDAIFEQHKYFVYSQPVIIEYGKPIYWDELSKEDRKHLGQYTQGVIRGMIEKNQGLLEEMKEKKSA